MKDPVVLQQLRNKGLTLCDEENLIYDAMERRQRILDDAPPRMKMTRMDTIETCGIAAQFEQNYNESVDKVKSCEVCYIDIGGTNKIQIDKKVYCVLRALILQNVSLSEEVATACGELFRAIVMCGESVITEGKLYAILDNYKATAYSATVILQTINKLCFSENSAVLFWNTTSQCDGYYQYAIKRGAEYIKEHNMTEKELKQFLKDNYKSAKADKEFNKKLAKGIPTRALVSMIYALRDDEKMFDTSGKAEGFMT